MFKQFAARVVFLALPALLTAQTYLPDGKGKEILDNYCQECHGLDPIIRQSLSTVEWRKLVARMVQKGTALKPAEVDALVDYLTAYFWAGLRPAKSKYQPRDCKRTRNEAGPSTHRSRSFGSLSKIARKVSALERLTKSQAGGYQETRDEKRFDRILTALDNASDRSFARIDFHTSGLSR